MEATGKTVGLIRWRLDCQFGLELPMPFWPGHKTLALNQTEPALEADCRASSGLRADVTGYPETQDPHHCGGDQQCNRYSDGDPNTCAKDRRGNSRQWLIHEPPPPGRIRSARISRAPMQSLPTAANQIIRSLRIHPTNRFNPSGNRHPGFIADQLPGLAHIREGPPAVRWAVWVCR